MKIMERLEEIEESIKLLKNEIKIRDEYKDKKKCKKCNHFYLNTTEEIEAGLCRFHINGNKKKYKRKCKVCNHFYLKTKEELDSGLCSYHLRSGKDVEVDSGSKCLNCDGEVLPKFFGPVESSYTRNGLCSAECKDAFLLKNPDFKLDSIKEEK